MSIESWPPHVWLDVDEKHVVFSHKCRGAIRTTQLPHPAWTMDPDGCVAPSIRCTACGFHDTLAVGGGKTDAE